MEAREVAELMAGWDARGGLRKKLRLHTLKDPGRGQWERWGGEWG